MNRRELVAAGAGWLCACARVPRVGEHLPRTAGTSARQCDHDLCRFWRPGEATVEVLDEGHRVGRCSLGLPEDV
ncbi:MAG: hypothetical protein JNJ54_10305 [Myxococcaceae bacterium]|nr:hypothetical protein [Myxococcaceae bacterium]